MVGQRETQLLCKSHKHEAGITRAEFGMQLGENPPRPQGGGFNWGGVDYWAWGSWGLYRRRLYKPHGFHLGAAPGGVINYRGFTNVSLGLLASSMTSPAEEGEREREGGEEQTYIRIHIRLELEAQQPYH